jgi:hypothetical protein
MVRALGNTNIGRGVNSLQFSMSGLQEGIYLIRIEIPGGLTAVKKVIKK